MANALQKTFIKLGATFALVTSAVGINDNKIMAQHPNFTPVVPMKTEVAVNDSAKTADSIAPNFKAVSNDEDTTKKRVATPDMPLDDQAAIYSMNNDAVGIAIWKGKDMTKYTDQQMIDFYEGMCRDSGVVGKVFITNELMSDGGNTTYAVFVNGHSVGGFMNGNDILSSKGLPRATMIQKGY